MVHILRRPRVSEDVAEIWDHIVDIDLAAYRWRDQMNRHCWLLMTQPLMGCASDELVHRRALARRFRALPRAMLSVAFTGAVGGE